MINQTLEDRKDRYIDAAPRVGADNKSIRPHKVSCVVVCVGRAEHLKLTLEHNAKLVDEIVVATSEGDNETAELICKHNDNHANGRSEAKRARMVYSDRHPDAAFNKGAMINDGLTTIQNPDWTVLTDSDVFLNPNLPEFVRTHSLNPGVLYSAPRHNVQKNTIARVGERDVLVAINSFTQATLDDDRFSVDAGFNGYFQLFNRRCSLLRDRWPNVMSEAFCSAGGVDSWFLQQWPAERRVLIPELSVVHVAHGEFGSGWNGSRRDCWRQMGYIAPSGHLQIMEQPENATRFRLTDTLHAGSIEGGVEVFNKVMSGPGGLVFDGKDIGQHHIHVAWR